MKQITEITNEYKQKLQPVLETGEEFTLQLKYSSQQNCWFANILYSNFEIKNVKLVLSSNLLYQWKNILPFGLMIVSTDTTPKSSDPFLLSDLTERVNIFILNKEEISEIENIVNNG